MIPDDTFVKACHIALRAICTTNLKKMRMMRRQETTDTYCVQKGLENRCGCGHHFDLAILDLHGGKCPIPGKSHFVGNRNL